MSLLLIDAGNTRIKWRAVGAGRVSRDGVMPVPEVAALATTWRDLRLRDAFISCVAAPAVCAQLADTCMRLGAHVRQVTPARQAHGVLNRYHAPECLGPDRYAALVAVTRAGWGDCVVVGAGTALTVDALTRDGEFLGGCIVPGRDLMHEALAHGTARVAVPDAQPTAWPRDTASAVATGIHLAHRGVVLALRRQLRAQVRRPVRIVLAGGTAAQLAPGLPRPLRQCEHLALDGLTWIARDCGCDA